MVFQDPMTSLNPLYTIQRQMEEVLILHEPQMNKAQRRERCIELLHAVGIPNPEERLKEYPNQFSGGMRQRVIIAIALATNPKLLIADEPTTSLDAVNQRNIVNFIQELCEKKKLTLLYISHNLALLDAISTHAATVKDGEIIEKGTREDVFHSPKNPYTRKMIRETMELTYEK